MELGFTVVRLDFKFLVLVRGDRKKMKNLVLIYNSNVIASISNPSILSLSDGNVNSKCLGIDWAKI